jgi:hypothetical protein
MKRWGCKTVEDVERFFDDGLKLPSMLGNTKLRFLNREDTSGSEFNKTNDQALLEKITDITGEFRGNTKSEGTAIHDVRLWKFAAKEVKTKNAFVLTLDRPMATLALREAGGKDEPLWRNLLGLIQILALNGGGPGFDPSNLAPLFRTFVDFEEIGRVDKFDKRDLLLLTEKNQRLKELPESKIRATLQHIHRAILSHDASKIHDAVIEVERFLRRNDSLKDQTAKEQASEMSLLYESIDTVKDENKELKDEIEWLFFSLKTAGGLVISYFLIWYLGKELLENVLSDSRLNIAQIIAQIIAPLIYISRVYFNTRKKINDRHKKV